MDQTAQIQTVNEAGTTGTLLTAGGALVNFVRPPSVTATISPGVSVTVRIVGLPGGTTDVPRTIAILISVP